MVSTPVALDALLQVRQVLAPTLRALLSEDDKAFLLAVKRGDADWSRFVFPDAFNLPAIQWKLRNLDKMDASKRQHALNKLQALLINNDE